MEDINERLMSTLHQTYKTVRRRTVSAILKDTQQSESEPIRPLLGVRGTRMDRRNNLKEKEQQAALQREMIIKEISAINRTSLREHGEIRPVPLSKLAHYFKVLPQNLNDSISKLEREGYLTKTRDRNNRHEQLLTLTELGQKRAAELNAIKARQNAEFLKPLSEEEKRTLLELLGKLNMVEEMGF